MTEVKSEKAEDILRNMPPVPPFTFKNTSALPKKLTTVRRILVDAYLCNDAEGVAYALRRLRRVLESAEICVDPSEFPRRRNLTLAVYGADLWVDEVVVYLEESAQALQHGLLDKARSDLRDLRRKLIKTAGRFGVVL